MNNRNRKNGNFIETIFIIWLKRLPKMRATAIIQKIIATVGLTEKDILSKESRQPEAIEYPPYFSLDYSHYGGEKMPCAKNRDDVLGCVFSLNGKHFIISHRTNGRMTLNGAKTYVKSMAEADKNSPYHWMIPTKEMVQVVQKYFFKFNGFTIHHDGDMFSPEVEFNTSVINVSKHYLLRLACWAPWLDQ